MTEEHHPQSKTLGHDPIGAPYVGEEEDPSNPGHSDQPGGEQALVSAETAADLQESLDRKRKLQKQSYDEEFGGR